MVCLQVLLKKVKKPEDDKKENELENISNTAVIAKKSRLSIKKIFKEKGHLLQSVMPDPAEEERKMVEKAEKDFYATIAEVKKERKEKGFLTGSNWGTKAMAYLTYSDEKTYSKSDSTTGN